MEKSKEKNKSFLRKVAIFLYLLALISLIVGICKMASHFSSVTERMFEDDFEEFDNFFSDGKLQSAISSFFSAFVLFIWGSVFMFISNSKFIKQQIEKKQEEQRKAEEAKKQESSEIKEVPKKRYFCAYCDNELDENDKKCPYCGAAKKIQK